MSKWQDPDKTAEPHNSVIFAVHSSLKSTSFTVTHGLTLQSSFGGLCFSVSNKMRVHLCSRKADDGKSLGNKDLA